MAEDYNDLISPEHLAEELARTISFLKQERARLTRELTETEATIERIADLLGISSAKLLDGLGIEGGDDPRAGLNS